MIVLIGKGGHAGVLLGILRSYQSVTQVEIGDSVPENAMLVLGIGDLTQRKTLFLEYGAERFISVRHRSANYSPTTLFGLGDQIMAGAIIQPNVEVGHNVLINTGAQIDHDCRVGDHVHIAPGAILCGGVTVGEGSFIGAGSIIPETTEIPPGSFIKAGSVYGKAA